MTTLAIVVAGLMAISAIRGLLLYRSVGSHAGFWRHLAEKPVPQNAIVLVALGDSTMQGVGAGDPLGGAVGKAMAYIQRRTDRPLHVINVSLTGATMNGVRKNQLSVLRRVSADIVLVSVGANDATKDRAVDRFEDDARAVLAALPKNRTVMTNVADVRGREPYQTALQRQADLAGIALSPVYETWRDSYRYRPQNYAADFFHPSARGYQAWQDAWQPQLDAVIAELDKKD